MAKQHFYDKDYVPQSLEDLYNSGWKEYILYHIRKYSLHDVNNSPEDLLQDMMVQMASTGFVEKFNPEISEFTKYLHTFIKNFMSKPYNKEHKTPYGNLVNHMSIGIGSNDQDGQDAYTISCERLSGSNTGDFTNYVCLVQSLDSDLKKIREESVVDYDKTKPVRDSYTVYKLLMNGYDVKDIADLFGTSKQFVYSLRKKLIDLKGAYV